VQARLQKGLAELRRDEIRRNRKPVRSLKVVLYGEPTRIPNPFDHMVRGVFIEKDEIFSIQVGVRKHQPQKGAPFFVELALAQFWSAL